MDILKPLLTIAMLVWLVGIMVWHNKSKQIRDESQQIRFFSWSVSAAAAAIFSLWLVAPALLKIASSSSSSAARNNNNVMA